jgi:crotonobetainyl-CoA:carnitine CoA-transferase CaiB-like acyl-CoA transferase
VEPAQVQPDPLSLSDKWNWRDVMLAGKASWPQEDAEGVRRLCESADVVVTSGDMGEPAGWTVPPAQVVCDLTAWGAHAQAEPVCETRMQALTGILATTGPADAEPLPVPVPLVETLCGMHAAGAVLAALRHARRGGMGQRIDMALYDCGFAAMSSFFSRLLVAGGGTERVRRLGNRHTLSAPWNVYRAADGWVLLCTGSDDQWRRLCALMERPALADDPRFLHSEDRVAHVAEVDAIVQDWLGSQDVASCVDAFARASIPGGPVAAVGDHPHEPNLDHRAMVHRLSRGGRWVAGSPLRMSRTPGRALVDVPDRGACRETPHRPARAAAAPHSGATMPLEGVRVLEIGHYTTAPIAARHLAALGADVVKIEPPQGEAARGWAPMVQGQSVFYTVSNSDKRDVTLDLGTDAGRAMLRELAEGADVLLENLKPGTLARYGFSPEQLAAMNPKLVVCAISGFGAESIYAARPAFDTVVQAMSGLMDLIRHEGVPYKTGTSTADVMGASLAVVSVLAALHERETSGLGQFIDLSMQDIVAWATHTAWGERLRIPMRTLPCAEGLLLAIGEGELPPVADAGRDDALRALQARGLRAAPVLAPAEVVNAPQTLRRELHFRVRDERGEWPALAVPLRLVRTPPVVHRPGPALGANNADFECQEKQEA